MSKLFCVAKQGGSVLLLRGEETLERKGAVRGCEEGNQVGWRAPGVSRSCCGYWRTGGHLGGTLSHSCCCDLNVLCHSQIFKKVFHPHKCGIYRSIFGENQWKVWASYLVKVVRNGHSLCEGRSSTWRRLWGFADLSGSRDWGLGKSYLKFTGQRDLSWHPDIYAHKLPPSSDFSGLEGPSWHLGILHTHVTITQARVNGDQE